MNKNPLVIPAYLGIVLLVAIAGLMALWRYDVETAKKALKSIPTNFESDSMRMAVEMQEESLQRDKERMVEFLAQQRQDIERKKGLDIYTPESIKELEDALVEYEKTTKASIAQQEKDLEKARAEYEAVKAKGK